MANYTFTSVLLLCSILLITGCCCLKVNVTVPLAVKEGDRAVLRCIYDLEGEQLYSVKWYRGVREFYRYTIGENPPKKHYPVPGLKVLENECNDTTVVLNDVWMKNSGTYICEVSTEGPPFFEMGDGVLEVVKVPKHDPVINGLEDRYRLGDVLKAECVSQGSRPAANLTWVVNDVPVDFDKVRSHHSAPSENGILNSHSALRLHLTPPMWSKGCLKIRCVASMYDVYYRSSEKSVELEGPCPKVSRPTTNWEDALSTKSLLNA